MRRSRKAPHAMARQCKHCEPHYLNATQASESTRRRWDACRKPSARLARNTLLAWAKLSMHAMVLLSDHI